MKLIGTLLARLIGAALALGLAAGIGLVLYAMSLLPELPDADTIADIQLKEPLQVYTSDAKLIGEYGNERRTPIDIENVPQALINAILAAEDDGFYEHPGIDIRGIIRAAIANLRSQGTGQGASTITMQVARNYFLTPEKTYRRKLKEVLLAFRLENQLNKDDILALYINKIFLGHRAYGFAAASFVYYGKPLEELNLAQAAMLAGLPKAPSKNNPVSNPHNAKQRRDYVLRRMRTLNYIDQTQFSEASNSPVTASRHIAQLEADAPYIAEMGRSYMLEKYGDTVYESGYNVYLTIDSRDQAAADKALRRGLMDYDQRHGYRGPIRTNQIASSTPVNQLEEILSEVPQSQELQPAIVVEIGKRSFKAYIKGDVVEVDWDGMKWARKYVSSRKIGAEPGRAGDIVNVGDIVYLKPGIETGWKLAQLPAVAGAIVSVEPKTGALRAVAGGFDYYLSKFNRALQAERQPGSNIKPFIYSAALEYGFTPASLVSGAPISVEDVAQGHWRPENYSGKFYGPTPLRKALSLSLNLVSVRLLRAMSIDYARDYLTRFGFNDEQIPQGYSLALGAASLTPVQMAKAYSVFANGGYLVEPYFVESIVDRDDITIYTAPEINFCEECNNTEYDPSVAPRVISAQNAFVMRSMLGQVIKSGTARRALELKRPDIGGKTGTTNDFRDAWFSGFGGDVVTSVWVGFDQPKDLGKANGKSESGAKAALPIWIDYMRFALQNYPEANSNPPIGVVSTFVNKETGQPTFAEDPDGYYEYFIAGTQPKSTAATNSASGGGVLTPKINDDLF